jgi:hypothetical protein
MQQEKVETIRQQLRGIEDPNELIITWRNFIGEFNQINSDLLFPSNDVAGGFVEDFIGTWLAHRIKLPIQDPNQVIDVIDDLINFLNLFKEHISNNREDVHTDILRCLRKGMRLFNDNK